MDNPQSINALAAAGVSKMRKTIWANKMDHLLIVIREGRPTVWSYLFCPMNKSLSGRDPLPLCAVEMDFDKAEWLPYTGPDAESAEYLAERERSTTLMSSSGSFLGKQA